MEWFLCDSDLHHERVKTLSNIYHSAFLLKQLAAKAANCFFWILFMFNKVLNTPRLNTDIYELRGQYS